MTSKISGTWRSVNPGTIVLALLVLAACNDSRSSDTASTSGATSAPLDAPPPQAAITRTADGSSESVVRVISEDDGGVSEVLEMHAYTHDGVTRFVSWSLNTLGVPDERHASVDGIQRELEASLAPVRAAERSVVVALADGVATGSIDARAMDAALARFEAVSSSRPASADILLRLHAALTPAERIALVDKVTSHYELSRAANDEDHPGPNSKGRLATLADQLGLDPNKVLEIRAKLRATPIPASEESRTKLAREVEARMAAFRLGFVSPVLDAQSLVGGDMVDGRLATEGATRMVHFFESVTPVLTPAQRVDLASRMRDRATDPNPLPLTPPSTPAGAKK
jgi:hypothetical protein